MMERKFLCRNCVKLGRIYLMLFALLLVNPFYLQAQICTPLSTIAGGNNHSVGLKEDGTVVAVGNDDGHGGFGHLNVSGWTNIKAVAAGGALTVGLKEDGTVEAVGSDWFGTWWFNVSNWTNIKAVDAGGMQIVGLKEDGTVVGIGANVANWTNIKAIGVGQMHTVGLKEDGTVVATGWNAVGQLNVSSWTDIKAIAAGYPHTVGLKNDGTVAAVGGDYMGDGDGFLNVSSWTNIKAIAAGYVHTVGLKEDGTVVAVGDNRLGQLFGQLNVSSWTNIKAIAAGDFHTLGLKEDGTVLIAGYTSDLQPNVTSWTDIREPSCVNPAAPTSLVASDTSCDNGGSMSLNWTLSQDDPAIGTGSNTVTGYYIYRSDTAGGPYNDPPYDSVGSGVSSYIDLDATDGTTYYYVVRATDGTNESADSNEASAASSRNLPLSPTGITATDRQYDLGGSITLAWTKSVDDGAGLNNVSEYYIYRSSSVDPNPVLLSSAAAGTTGYADNTAVDGVTYYYTINAFDSQCNMESVDSDTATGQSIDDFEALPGFISSLAGISSQLRNNLMSQAQNALGSFENGNRTLAVAQLNSMLNQISAQTGLPNGIEASAAQTLTNYIQSLIVYINA